MIRRSCIRRRRVRSVQSRTVCTTGVIQDTDWNRGVFVACIAVA
jgi:hypothetical protein